MVEEGIRVWHVVERAFVNTKGNAISVRNARVAGFAHIREFDHSARIAEVDLFVDITVFVLYALNVVVGQFVSTNVFVASVIFARRLLRAQVAQVLNQQCRCPLENLRMLLQVEQHLLRREKLKPQN